MDTFEQAFSDTERAAEATLRAAANLSSHLKALQKAARVGNIAAIKRAQSSIEAALVTLLPEEVDRAVTVWPYQDDEEVEYIRTQYSAELRKAAAERGVVTYEGDGPLSLVAHPSMLRVLPGERAVRVDGKRVSAIRPSHLAALLLDNQKKPARHQSGQFLEALYRVYVDHVRDASGSRMLKSVGDVVPLEMVYTRLTYLPSSNREFDRNDFARAVYNLDAGGMRTTRSGATVSFPSSAGNRSPKGLFTSVGPDGQRVRYYGIRFTEAS